MAPPQDSLGAGQMELKKTYRCWSYLQVSLFGEIHTSIPETIFMVSWSRSISGSASQRVRKCGRKFFLSKKLLLNLVAVLNTVYPGNGRAKHGRFLAAALRNLTCQDDVKID